MTTGYLFRAAENSKFFSIPIESWQPSPQAFSARSILDSTVSCDVNERYSQRTRSLARSFPDFARTKGQERTTRDQAGRLGSSGVDCKFIFLLDENMSRVRQNLKNTLTMLSSEVDRICSSLASVWEQTSFCQEQKDSK